MGLARAALTAMESAQRRRKRSPAMWALALELAAVAIEGGHAQKRGGLAARERAQLRAEGPRGGRRQCAHARDGDEPRRLGREHRLRGEGFGDGRLDLGDLRALMRRAEVEWIVGVHVQDLDGCPTGGSSAGEVDSLEGKVVFP